MDLGGRVGAVHGPVERLTRLIPEEALVRYHLCYGTFPEWTKYEPRDMGLMVRMANYAVANSGRRVDWLHLAGPRYLRSEDERFFHPLAGIDPGAARVFLGIVLPIDGASGPQRRHRTASRFLTDFGVAMYCGLAVNRARTAWRLSESTVTWSPRSEVESESAGRRRQM